MGLPRELLLWGVLGNLGGRRGPLSGDPAEAGPVGVPEEDHAAFGQHVGDPNEVPLLPLTGVEGILDLLSDVGTLVHHQLLGVVPPWRCSAMSSPSLPPPRRGSLYKQGFRRLATGFVSLQSYSPKYLEEEFPEVGIAPVQLL